MSYRAEKSGLAKDIQKKNESKYDAKVAGEIMEWISCKLKGANDSTPVNTSGAADDVYDTLKDGHVLARLLKAIDPAIAKKCHTEKRATMAFKIMEDISLCTAAMIEFGVDKAETFQTVDLTEKVNIWQVVICLMAVSRRCKGGVGPKESTPNRRSFTKEQLRAGEGVIGLQMGTNKGANQSGMNIGNTRHITD